VLVRTSAGLWAVTLKDVHDQVGEPVDTLRRPTNVLAHNGRAFWKLTDADSGALAWLAFTRPDARSALARRKVWTLIPYLQVFIANWFVSVDHERRTGFRWPRSLVRIYEDQRASVVSAWHSA
jgi:hypothetical protein